MNHKEHMMTIAAEEAMEVGHRITKALRFGLSEVQAGQDLTNGERIIEEFHDLYVMLKWLQEDGHLPIARFEPSIGITNAKRSKVRKFMAISEREGTLDAGGGSMEGETA